MDEPTSSLDFGNRIRVLDKTAELARQGYTILLSCHDPQLALLYADRVVALHQGRVLADGRPEAVLTESLLHTLYQVPVRMTPTEHGTLLSPVRRHVYHWTAEMVAYMEAAAERSDFYQQIARAAAEAAPGGGVICDAGCGLGFSSLALAPYFQKVVAADRSAEALAVLRRKNTCPNLELLEGDLFAQPPDTPYDAMLFCFFGSAEEILRCARRQCRGRVVVVKPTRSRHRFSRGQVPDHRQVSAALEDRLLRPPGPDPPPGPAPEERGRRSAVLPALQPGRRPPGDHRGLCPRPAGAPGRPRLSLSPAGGATGVRPQL